MDTATQTTVNLTRIASRLVTLYRLLMEAQRPIDLKVTGARLNGACEALNAVGFGMTDFQVRLAVKDAWDAQWAEFGARPGHSGVGNEPQKDWDARVIRRVQAALEGML